MEETHHFQGDNSSQLSPSVHAVAEGIRNKTISNADILFMSLQKSAKKASKNPFGSPIAKGSGLVVNKNLFGSEEEATTDENQDSNQTLERFDRTSNGDFLYRALERSAKKKGRTVIEAMNISSDEPIASSSTEYSDRLIVSDEEPSVCDVEDNSTTCTDDFADTPEHLKSLKKRLKLRIMTSIERQMLDILNRGTFEQLTQLHGIGKVRANKILSLREESDSGISLEDLQNIGMTSLMIKKLFSCNVENLISSMDE